jgi:hypothetical protein
MNKIQKILICAAMSAAAAVTGCKDDGGDHTTTGTNGDTYFENPTNTGTGGNETVVGEVKIDTLMKSFSHPQGTQGWLLPANGVLQLVKDEAELASYLKLSEANSAARTAHTPDFNKWTYFSFIGTSSARQTVDVTYREDTTIINYVVFNIPYECRENPCEAPSSPPPMTAVYFMPFTDKPIEFTITRQTVTE